ncbi:hypothetical protein MNBD_DELTA01-1619 [hydrothermal vent metagenome]|uniref:Uncharacterized protein n=1 Tax=hydrothermal vent metagenome TaxID=652676 RepID=A0A3B0RCX6_9ZZZZ
MGLSVRFPANCRTEASKIAWCYRAEELLRIYHNIMGRWSKRPIDNSEWDKLSGNIKARFSFKAEALTKAEWDEYRDNFHRPKEQAIIGASLASRALAKGSAFWAIDIDGDIS